MKCYLKCVLTLLFLLSGFAASAQRIQTWIGPQSSAESKTNVVATNQVMEVLTCYLDPDSQIEILRGGDRLLLGNSGGSSFNTPFAISGPAVIVFRKTATGGQGSFVTYRLVSQPNQPIITTTQPFGDVQPGTTGEPIAPNQQ